MAKVTPADALQDAIEVLRAADQMSMTDFIDAMEGRGVTVGAAQDVLKYMEGVGTVKFTSIGNIAYQLVTSGA